MSILFAVLLAAASFAIIAFGFGLPRKTWTLLLTGLTLGLAGYAFQASPDLPGAPDKPNAEARNEEGWAIVEMRKDLVGPDQRSKDPLLITADALARRGQYMNSALLLRGAVRANPQDFESWLALGNTLTFQANGMLSPAALLAYRRASQLAPDSAGPAFFIGWAMIRQGKLIEGREIWVGRLESMPADAPGRDALTQRLANFDAMLRELVEQAGQNPR